MSRRGETWWSVCRELVHSGDKPGVPGVFLEGEAEEGDLLAGDGVEETVYDPAGETPPLVLVHVNHLKRKRKKVKN